MEDPAVTPFVVVGTNSCACYSKTPLLRRLSRDRDYDGSFSGLSVRLQILGNPVLDSVSSFSKSAGSDSTSSTMHALFAIALNIVRNFVYSKGLL